MFPTQYNIEVNIMQDITRQLKTIRTTRGISQKSIARRMGVSLKSVVNWENRKRNMTLEHALKYASELGFDLILRQREEEAEA